MSLVPIPGIKFGPTFNANGQQLTNNLLLIQCLPSEILSDGKVGVAASGDLPPIDKGTGKGSPKEVPIYSNPYKVQLLMQTGTWWEGQITIGLAAGIGVGIVLPQRPTPPTDQRRKEAEALGLGISLIAEAEIGLKGQLMQLEAFGLSEYRTLFDNELLKVFGRILTKIDEKKMVQQALRFVNSKFPKDNPEEKEVWRTAFEPGSRTPVPSDEYGCSLEDAGIIIKNATRKAQVEYRTTYPGYKEQKEKCKDFLLQLDRYRTALNKPPDFTKIRVDGNGPRNNFLRLWGYGGKGDLGFKAGVIVGVSLVDASTAAEGRLAATNFRLQTQTQKMIQTQETTIQYRQVTLTAEVTGAALQALEVAANKLASSQTKLETGATKVYNSLVYRSALVRWLNPVSQSDNQVLALRGTGICFGVSIPVGSLVELAQKTNDDFEKDELAKSLAVQLCVNVKQLQECLVTSWFSDPELTVENCLEYFPTDAVLLESGFALTVNNQKFNLARGSNVIGNLLRRDPITLQDDLLGSLDNIRTTQKTMELQSIRVRFRIADLRSNTSTLFMLGIPGTKIGITLRGVTEAGAEGIVDLYTHWFGKDRTIYNERPVEVAVSRKPSPQPAAPLPRSVGELIEQQKPLRLANRRRATSTLPMRIKARCRL